MAAALPEVLLENIFFRLPPDEPAWLVLPSLVCKPWLGVLSDADFRDRYRDHHGAPPMLGFLCDFKEKDEEPRAPELFIPTTKFRPRIPDGCWRDLEYGCAVLDCRHGRALLQPDDVFTDQLIVWDPMTGYQRELNKPPRKYREVGNQSFAVLCAASGCHHRACHEGPFLVVFVGLRDHSVRSRSVAHACVFSSETGEWSKPCSKLNLEAYACIDSRPLLVEDALYIMFEYNGDPGILKYDLGSNCLSLVDVPVDVLVLYDGYGVDAMLMAMEDGSLGLAVLDGLNLHLWSRKMGSDKSASWAKLRVINLENLLPTDNPMEKLSFNGAVEGSDIIFVTTSLGVYEFNLKSLELKKLWKKIKHHHIIPYMSFYHPRGKGRHNAAAH